jgi:hypothetical protein
MSDQELRKIEDEVGALSLTSRFSPGASELMALLLPGLFVCSKSLSPLRSSRRSACFRLRMGELPSFRLVSFRHRQLSTY